MSKRPPSKSPKSKPPQGDKARADVARYDRIAARATSSNLAASRAARDVAADAPPIADQARRDRATGDLEFFLRDFFPETFRKPFAPDQITMIRHLQDVITSGGQLAIAAPRGGGKTSICERSALWGVLTGRRKFVVLVAATESHAEQSLGRLKAELEFNGRLLGCWPKAIWPVRRLESQGRRCTGQTWDGARTCIQWGRKRIVLPSVPGPDSEASGGILHTAGITGAIRGLSHVGPSGETVRPSLVLIDDPSTRESAASFVQNAQRLAVIQGDLAGLAGPGETIASLAAVTVVYKGDLADRLLDREEHPEWYGQRFQMVYRWPDAVDLWAEYERLRLAGAKARDGGRAATEFYSERRREMDAGAVVAWPERYEAGELSALQHAFNLRIRLKDGFWAEFQNMPVEPAKDAESLDPVAIASRCGGFDRGVAPPEVERVVAFVDVGGDLHWWLVAGFDEQFGASILDYGPFPRQPAAVFLARNASPTLAQAYPGAGSAEAAVYEGLRDLVNGLAAREWRRSDGAILPLSRLGIDSGWNSDLVRRFIRQSPHREKLVPTKGMGIGATRTALADQTRHPGEKAGEGWVLGAAGPDRLRLLRFDANFAKSRVADMLTRPMGLPGGITLFGDRPESHELLAVHLSSEYPTLVEANGRAVQEWQRRPDKENHMFDCLIGCAAMASLEGLSPLTTVGGIAPPPPKRRRLSFAQMAEEKKRQKGLP